MTAPALPPLLSSHAVAEPEAAARDGEAGDVFHDLTADRLRAAFVLESDRGAEAFAQMAPLMLLSVADALGAIGPPNLGIFWRWPETVLANGATVGAIRVAPDGAGRALLLIELTLARDVAAPGDDPSITALAEEGCGDLDPAALLAAIARHFLTWLDDWEAHGFARAHRALSGLLDDGALAANGDLLTPPRQSLAAAFGLSDP